jgi:hypothetical protein
MWRQRLRPKMLSMHLLLPQPLAEARDVDAARAGSRTRSPLRFPQRAALLGQVRSRRATRLARRAAHA